MRLTVINGSPRGKSSNTRILLDHFLDGFLKNPENTCEVFYLNKMRKEPELQKNFLNASAIIVAFPLYVDAMPGIVKEYFELLDRYKGVNPGLKLGFIVQSGFTESYHSFFIARYLKKYAKDMETVYLGTIIRGGVEGIQMKPAWMNHRLFKRFHTLGEYFGEKREFDQILIKKLARPVRLKGLEILLFRILKLIGLDDFYWNSRLKTNHVYDKRFAQLNETD